MWLFDREFHINFAWHNNIKEQNIKRVLIKKIIYNLIIEINTKSFSEQKSTLIVILKKIIIKIKKIKKILKVN